MTEMKLGSVLLSISQVEEDVDRAPAHWGFMLVWFGTSFYYGFHFLIF